MKQANLLFLFQMNAHNMLNTDCKNARSRKLQSNRQSTKNKAGRILQLAFRYRARRRRDMGRPKRRGIICIYRDRPYRTDNIYVNVKITSNIYIDINLLKYKASFKIIIIIIIIIVIIIISYHRPFLPGNSVEPTVIRTAQASCFTLQYVPHYV